jgi:hypothetical protein
MTTKRDSLEVQGVPIKASKIYKFTTKQASTKQHQRKLVDSQTNNMTRPPQMRI